MVSPSSVLAINRGSSSIKFAVYQTDPHLKTSLTGKLDRVGLGGTTLAWQATERGRSEGRTEAPDGESGARFLTDWLEARPEWSTVTAMGHRVVHGLAHSEPARVTTELLDELHRAGPYAPDHLPREIALIEAFRERHPDLPQVACFDTAFHAAMPRVATVLPIPRRYQAKGVRRYGFHGLSYAYLMEELGRAAGPQAANGRVILAHLGNGASMAAVQAGMSIDTSMGFTPAAGLVMSTRTGDLDPGLMSFFALTERMTPQQFNEMVHHESGLLGVSEISSDMRDLLAREAGDVRAAEAVALFCYQARKWVGAFAAALGGLDTLVFSAGIGEQSASIRARICEGLGFLGIELHDARNADHAAVISTDASRVTVRIIPTNEELMIARSVSRVLGLDGHITEPDA
ncbi:MAG: acetate/propionate family kinase [Vicinamibacterales bacterium]|jgi:acetate kinase